MSFRYLSLITAFVAFISAPAFAQTMERRMVLDRHDCDEPASKSEDEDSNCLVELISVQIAGTKIVSGKPFISDENWLSNLKVRLRNVSGRPFFFVGVSFGLIEGLYEELSPGASWGWGFGLFRGTPSDKNSEKRKFSKTVVLRPNEEIELTFSDLPTSYSQSPLMQVVGRMSQIVLITSTIEFGDGSQTDSRFFMRKANTRKSGTSAIQ